MKTYTRSVRSRLVSAGLLVVLLAGTASATIMLRNLVRAQDERLLDERAGEAGLVVSSFLTSLKPSMQVLGATYLVDPEHSVAGTLTQQFASRGGTTAIIEAQNNQLVARVAGGSGIVANQPLAGARAALVRRSLTAKDLVTAVMASGSGRKRLAFAIALPGNVVVYQEIEIQPRQLTESGRSSPFNELEGAVYVARTADPSKLLFSTASRLPLRGDVDEQSIDIGADQWLLVASARRPLSGAFASTAPWIVGALGVLVSLIACAAVDLLLRRRAYALALVEERTAALRRTMADLEAARAGAEAANQAKSEFLSRMSHELRTPLNAVLGFAQVLELGDLTDAQAQSVTQITKGGRHLLELINDVLDISRIETGRLTLSAEPVLVDDVVNDVLDLVEPLAAHRDISCTTVGDTTASYVLADRQRLRQILLNLLSNAVKYNSVGGSVTVSYGHRAPDRLRIQITDTGPGIPADRLELLFEPFERLGAEQTNIEGAGIGLALSRRLAEAMNGTVDVASTVGEGSTFWVELQLIEGPVEQLQRTTRGAIAPPPIADGAPKRTVLYIEDNLANVKLIEHILDHRPDIQLITAMQGRIGIDLALQHHPELILLDLHLPDISGETVLAELRANPSAAVAPIIVLSADATERQQARLLAAGADAYLTKPIDVQQLLEMVDSKLAGSDLSAGRPGVAVSDGMT